MAADVTHYVKYVARVGALAVVLGVGGAVATTPGVAWAEPSESASTDSTSAAPSGPTTSTDTESDAPAADTSAMPETTSTNTPDTAGGEPADSPDPGTPSTPTSQQVVTLDGGVIVRSS